METAPDDESYLPIVENPLLKIIAKYEIHQSISRIKNYIKEKDWYSSFEFVYKSKSSKEINKSDKKLMPGKWYFSKID